MILFGQSCLVGAHVTEISCAMACYLTLGTCYPSGYHVRKSECGLASRRSEDAFSCYVPVVVINWVGMLFLIPGLSARRCMGAFCSGCKPCNIVQGHSMTRLQVVMGSTTIIGVQLPFTG